jgi:hypothetical protein
MLFLSFVGTVALGQVAATSSAPVASCDQLNSADPPDPVVVPSSLTPLPGLTLSVKVNFLDSYPGETREPWTLDQQKIICAAAHHVQLAWSSVEFKKQLDSILSMVLAKRILRSDLTKTGPELYILLTTHPVIINLAHSAEVPQCAVSLPEGSTSVQTDYLQNGTRFSCGAPLLAALTNTLAHEFTHYSPPVGSTDNRKSSVNNLNWVSYGIGCITENVAFAGSPCKYKAY